MKVGIFITILLAGLLPLAVAAQSTNIAGNVYRAGVAVTVSEQVDGDVYAAGQVIIISGHVSGDVLAVGQKIIVDGTIDGNLRALAQQIIINGVIKRNSSFIADSFTVADMGSIGQSIAGVGTYCTVVGPVGRDVEGIYSTVILASSVGRDVRVRVHNDFNFGLQILSTARINGLVDYYAYRQMEPAKRAVISGQMTWHQLENQGVRQSSPAAALAWWVWLIIRLVGLSLVTWIFWKLGGKAFERVVDTMQQRTAAALWWGLLLLVLSPIIIVAIALTLIGLPLALFLAAIYALGLIFFAPWAIVMLGQQLLVFFGRKPAVGRIRIIVLGVLVFFLLTNLPYIGNLLYCLLIILVWGALWQSLAAIKKK
ncbi:MAG: polymer-forming cytoskeletal protein [Candidatus Komeilibacteria bacterium]